MKRIFQFFYNPFFRTPRMPETVSGENFWANVKKQFRNNRLGVFALRFLYVFILIALLADLLANEKPLVAAYKDGIYFPVFRSYAVDLGLARWQKEFQNIDWKNFEYDWALFPPIPYSPATLDFNNDHSVSPFDDQKAASLRWRHWLGTDEIGRDVFSGMIHGTRVALTVGLVAMGIASLFGILIGAVAGYFGDERLKISRAGVVMNAVFFWGFIARSYELSDALAISFGSFSLQVLLSLLIFTCSLLLGNLLSFPFRYLPYLRTKVSVPVDILLSRFIEIVVSVPTLFLIIIISSIVDRPSIYIVMAVIGLTSWPNIARFIRAEMLRIRSLEYIEAAHALGYPEWRVILRHAIPNALSPVLVTIAFGIAAAILIESTLSFLGVGVSAETVTWGSLLAAARQSPSAWWLAIIPGCAIFITVTVFNLIGEALTDALDPRQKK